MLYRVLEDDNLQNGTIVARHKWGLPGVTCPTCDEAWSVTGIAYPSIDLTALLSKEQYEHLWPVKPDRLEELRRPLLHLVPNRFIPPPGTKLGPLVGEGRGTFKDFAWPDPWTPLMQPESLERLRVAAVRLPRSVPTLIRFQDPTFSSFQELEIEPRSRLSTLALSKTSSAPCATCGRLQATMPDTIVVEKLSIPLDVDIFRDQMIPTLLLAKERFVQAVMRLKLRGAVFNEVMTD